MAEVNKKRELSFSDEFVECYLVENVENYIVEKGIVVNLDNDGAIIAGNIPSVIPAWKSSTLINGMVGQAKRIIVLNVRDEKNLGGIQFNWDWFGNRLASFPRKTPLYISNYDWVGETRFDPFVFANQSNLTSDLRDYNIRINLWWSPTNTDCSMHNEHPFIEIHTQIYGRGRIQKFTEKNEDSLYEYISLASGYTHDPFALITKDGTPIYPWHRYWSDSDAIWLAIEFHPK